MHLFDFACRHACFVTVAALSLAACGGGGESSPAPAPNPAAPTSTNVSAAYASAIRQPHTYILTGKASTGTGVTASLSIAPAGTVSYNGVSFDTTTLTSMVDIAGSPASTSVTTIWLQQGATTLMFESSAPEATCMYVSSQNALPTTANLGQAGLYATATQYAGCLQPGTIYTSDVSVGTVTETWSYTSIGGAGFVCMTSSNAGFVGTSTEQDCFEVIDANGTLGTRARVTIQDLNGVITTLATR